jgi:nicotinate dehydrogenase subunit A
MAVSLNVNGVVRSVPAEPDTPLLYALRNDFEFNGAKFGCGLAQCGACTVLIDGTAVRSCVTPIGTVANSQIITLEGLGTLDKPHPLQRAFIGEQAAQCGYCINGMIMTAKAVEVGLINRPAERALRAGEGSQGPTVAAIANAFAHATGRRIRDLPFHPERVKAVLA